MISKIFKTAIVTNLNRVVLESSYTVLQVTFKWKTLKQPIYFLKAVEFCLTFDTQIDITGYILRKKNTKPHFLESPQRSLKTRQKKLLLHFIEYRLDQLNSKHTKIEVNSTIQYFEGHSQNKCRLNFKSFCFTHHKMSALYNFCEIERKPSFNDQYFQT